MTPDLFPAFVILKPPVLDAERLEQRLDGKLIVRLAGDRLANERRVDQCVRRVAATGPRIERQLRRARVTGVAEDIFPGAVVACAGGFGTDARGMIEQLFDCDYTGCL